MFILIGSYLYLLLNIFYHRPTASVFRTALFDTLWRLWKLLFFEENIFKVFLYLCFIIEKPLTSITQEWLVVKSCLTPQWITFLMFYRLVYNIRMTWFKLLDFGLKCLVTITPKGQPLRFKVNVWNIPTSEAGRNCNSLFKLADINWVVIMEQKRKMEYNWACTSRANQG